MFHCEDPLTELVCCLLIHFHFALRLLDFWGRRVFTCFWVERFGRYSSSRRANQNRRREMFGWGMEPQPEYCVPYKYTSEASRSIGRTCPRASVVFPSRKLNVQRRRHTNNFSFASIFLCLTLRLECIICSMHDCPRFKILIVSFMTLDEWTFKVFGRHFCSVSLQKTMFHCVDPRTELVCCPHIHLYFPWGPFHFDGKRVSSCLWVVRFVWHSSSWFSTSTDSWLLSFRQANHIHSPEMSCWENGPEAEYGVL
jgi:hypothetical protein